MTNFSKIAVAAMTILLMGSCQNSANEPNVEHEDLTLELISSMSQEDFMRNCFAVKSQMKSVSRSTQLTDLEAQQIMQPFVEDGLQLQTEIIEQLETEPTMAEELAYFSGLSEVDCAALSFVFHSLNEAGMEVEVVTGTLDKIETQQMTVTSERLIHCAAAAVGINAIKELGVGGVVTAATVRQAIIAIGRRYLGYIGLALLIYDFVECIS